MDKIINTKFTETLYGNPSKEDLSNVDLYLDKVVFSEIMKN